MPYPNGLTCASMAEPMSLMRLPGTIAAMPFSSASRVSVVPVLDHAVVQLQQVAFDEPAPGGDAVDDLLVHRDADVLGEPVQPLERADAAAADGLALGDGVELLQRDAGRDGAGQLLEHLVDDQRGLAHVPDLVAGLDLDSSRHLAQRL